MSDVWFTFDESRVEITPTPEMTQAQGGGESE